MNRSRFEYFFLIYTHFVFCVTVTVIDYKGCQGMLVGKFSVFCMQFQMKGYHVFLILWKSKEEMHCS